jgi:glycopeptide antibiotics resistance protein
VSVRVSPAVVAVIFAVGLAVLLFVPFVAREHRKRGELGGGTAILCFAVLLYTLGLLAYVLLPLPTVTPSFCRAAPSPQWIPLASFDGARWQDWWPLLATGAVGQFGLNILLFVPLGMFVRHLFSRGLVTTVMIGFGVSLTVELTQLTGIWFLYPCAYRLFDVDDLIANTLGALLGAVLTPILRPLPGQRSDTAAAIPRPVTGYRRLLGMCCDVLLLWLLSISVARLLELSLPARTCEPIASALVLLATTAVGRGSTLGQHAVLLRSVTTGRRSLFSATVLRWALGLGGLAIAEGLTNAVGRPRAGAALAIGWCTLHAFGVTRSHDHRGISGWVVGLQVVDARTLGAGNKFANN